MANSPASISTPEALPVLRAALKTLPCVRRVVVNRDDKVCYVNVDVDGRRVLAAAVYPAARVVMPLSRTAASGDLGEILNDAVCGAANAHGLTILHGVGVDALGGNMPNEGNFIRERELTAATMPLEQAHAQRLLAELAGTRLPTGVALLTGAPLERGDVDFPLTSAELHERERLQAIVGRAGSLKFRIWNTQSQIKSQNERIALAEERIVESTVNIAVMNAEIAQWNAELAALDTPEAVRERLEAAAQLRGEADPES
ncbi:hypothetical protein GCM10010840_14690 [Deinococcus aerolatus]|uniref:Uncharacterized protein n=1 Tax=Deinococcus aerolatus TaxID=522487 RepID=A0ABQ2G6Y7_9DEIO|nr:hypothetical protein [Deinococcus aerolatus]GGL77867.1 hypothetical protein GCM10010840_14690 [Deinococcus aerolatus]